MKGRHFATAALALSLLQPISARQSTARLPTQTDIAPGIILFRTPEYGDVGLDGNSIAVISNDGVLVFDTNGTPSAAAAVLAAIRASTDKPVRWIVNSHWHWDHWYGSETYVRAFPDVRIVAHEKTRQLMAGPAIAFNRPFLEDQLPAYLRDIERRAETRPDLKPLLGADTTFLAEKKNVHLTLPTTTFTDRMTIDLGERHMEVLNYGRGVTPGDAFVYLPKERVLLLGDLIVNPITFALSGYPTEWLRALERVDALDVNTIVTGHGAPLHDKALLRATMAVFRVLLQEGKTAKARGLSADEARDAIIPGLHDLMIAITGDRPELNSAFRQQLVDWYLHRVYEELDGPLSDAIASIPRT